MIRRLAVNGVFSDLKIVNNVSHAKYCHPQSAVDIDMFRLKLLESNHARHLADDSLILFNFFLPSKNALMQLL